MPLNRRRPRVRPTVLLTVVTVALAAGAASAQIATTQDAQPSDDPAAVVLTKIAGYSASPPPELRPIDPIGVVFIGRAASTPHVRGLLRTLMGWRVGKARSDQWVRVAGRPIRMGGEQASGCAACPRDHIRLATVARRTREGDPVLITVGTPHHDAISSASTCRFPYGHVARDVNGVRDRIAARFAQAGYSVTWRLLNNTIGVRQCDGTLMRSRDGRIAVITLDTTASTCRDAQTTHVNTGFP